ncbi:G-type lectin S-receptor-like serine/threonine-protein kinase SD2-5 [Lycium ferocissimum]|uniref:G-type lectin S-receptor-like serine/threonine-protein kinase SD2-5 n=1 Tax=Lycium ferocissimum TaxID=112874 RepID=UPI002815D7EB|nr:G-type lectin S-receptor-like serine/threonine-protein kinase SD2-5 [Lycium ferocissimum]
MVAEQRHHFPILLFIYLLFWSFQFALSDYTTLFNSTARLSSFWINRPPPDYSSVALTRILQTQNDDRLFVCGFCCYVTSTNCYLGILLFDHRSQRRVVVGGSPQLVWSANRDHPVKANATLQLGQDGNLVLADSDGTLVWSTDTTGKSVSGLNLTEMGNLVLFDKRKRTIWQSFDHPTDSLLPGQNLVFGRKLTATNSSTNLSFSFTVLNGSLVTYVDTDPPQYFIASNKEGGSFYSFDGRTFAAPSTSESYFIKLGSDGHLMVLQMDAFVWKQLDEVLYPDLGNCGYPLVCGRYSICTNDGQCNCPVEGNFFRPINRNPDLGCSQLKSISCNSSQYHSLIELKETTYFAFETNYKPSSSMWFEGTKLEDCKTACLSNCSCKAVVWSGTLRKNCLLLNEVFSLMDNRKGSDKTTVFLKVQNTTKSQYQSPIISQGKQSKPLKVIVASTLAALVGIILSISTWFVLFKKRTLSNKVGDLLDLAHILPGILTRFSYHELKIITQDFSRKLGEGGFGSVYEGTLSNGIKIAVKRLDRLDQVKDSFLSIPHVNLVKFIGFCAEKDHRVLIYEYMVNGSLDRWIFREKQENELTWHTRKRIIADIAKGLAYLHDECSQKIIHLDIKPQNILLDQNFNARISDFGLSKLIEKDTSKVVTRMRGTPGYLAPEWLRSEITEKVDVYAFGIVLLELLCGRKNVDRSQADEDVHLLSVFRRKAEEEQLMDMVDQNNEDMQINKQAATELMILAAWCVQDDFTKRPSMTLVVKVLEGLVSVETNIDYDFTSLPEVGAGNQQKEATISSVLPSVLSGPR